MKKLYFIFSGFILLQSVLLQAAPAPGLSFRQVKIDTAIIPVNKEEDKVIDEVIESKTPAKKEVLKLKIYSLLLLACLQIFMSSRIWLENGDMSSNCAIPS